MNRYQGFPDPDGLLLLDTLTGELILCARHGERRLLNPGRSDAAITTAGFALAPSIPAVNPSAASTSITAATLGDLPPDLDDLDREVILTFPVPVARIYFEFLREEEPSARCRLLVDTFTAVLKLQALQLASEYLRADGVRDRYVQDLLVNKLPRPSLTDWNNLIRRTLQALQAAKVPTFAGELPRAYAALESECRQLFRVSVPYEDGAGRTQERTKHLRKFEALIYYRNRFSHGFKKPPEQAQHDLDTYLPLLREVLRESRFLARYPLWHVCEGRRGSEPARGIRLMGARPSEGPEPVEIGDLDPRVSPLCLRNEATGAVLPLPLFFDVRGANTEVAPGRSRDVIVFEGTTKSTVMYVSTAGLHVEKELCFRDWLRKSKHVATELVDAASLTFKSLQSAARQVTEATLAALVQSGKYLREASVERAELRKHLGSFEFGKYGAFVLGGESGIGKTTLLAQFVETRLGARDVVVFHRASALPGADLADRLLRDLGIRDPDFDEFLPGIARLFVEGRRFWLVLDAVNEFGHDVAALVRNVDQLVQRAAGHDWFRVVVSVRDGAYRRLPSDARFGAAGMARYYTVEREQGGRTERTPIVALAPIDPEHVEALYEAYRAYRQHDPDDPEAPAIHRFRPTTTFAELPEKGSTRALLRSPLMARLLLEAFHARALPGDLRSHEAMQLHLDHVVVEKDHPSGGFHARERLLRHLVRVLDKAGSDVLLRDALLDAGQPDVRNALLNAQRDSPYVQLLELGVLREEWEDDACYVRFAFDRFFEFLLAGHHGQRPPDADAILALADRAISFKSLRGALEVVLGRACEQGRESLLIEVMDRSSQRSQENVRDLLRGVAAKLIERLARERNPVFSRLLAEMPKEPSADDVDVLLDVADRLELLGEATSLDLLLETLVTEARALGDPKRLGLALLSAARRLDVRGDWDRALETYEAAARSALLGEDRATHAHALLGTAALRDRRGDPAGAEAEMRAALEIFIGNADRSGESQALLNLGYLAMDSGDYQESERYFRAALLIEDELEDVSGRASCQNALGNLAIERGDFEEAEKHYRASLAIVEETGDKAGIASRFNNLGVVAQDRGDVLKADQFYRDALEFWESIGDKQEMAMSHSNLGIIARDLGHHAEAERHFRKSLALDEEIGDRIESAAMYGFLGDLAHDRGDKVEAERLHREALAIVRGVGNALTLQGALYSLGVLRWMHSAHDASPLLEEVRALVDSVRTPRAPSLGAQAGLLLTLGASPASESVADALDAVREARAGEAARIDVHDGPAVPYLVAARWFREHGEVARAVGLAREALDEVGDRFWPYRAEAEAMCIAPIPDMAEAGR